MKEKKNKKKYIIFLSLLSLLVFASVIRYGLQTYQIPTWDEQHYMRMATAWYRLLQQPHWNTPYDMLQVVPFRQPGYPLVILPFYFLFGLSKAYFWALVVNGLLYIATMWGIYFLARVYLSNLASFLAALFFACYGWTLLHLFSSYSETAVSAFSVLTILFLLKSNYFQNKKYSLLFGLFLGCGLLIKWMTLVYVSGAMLFVFYQMVKKQLFKKRSVVLLALSSFFIAMLVSFYPYYTNFSWYFDNWFTHQQGGEMWQVAGKEERNPLSLYSLTYYINTFSQLGLFYFVLFILGLFFALKKKSNIKVILFIFCIGYAFSIYAVLKAERYIVPIFPYVAIISASVFDYIKNSWKKTALVFFAIVLSFTSYLGSVWGKGIMKQSLVSVPLPFSFGQIDKVYFTAISRPPYIYKISGNEILEFIAKDSKQNNLSNPQIIALFSYRSLDEPLMVYNLYNLEKPFEMNNYVGTLLSDPKKESKILLQNVFHADYFLIKTKQKTDTYFPKENYKTLLALITLFEKDDTWKKYFEKKEDIWINQDSSIVSIWKKKKDISPDDLIKMNDSFVY